MAFSASTFLPLSSQANSNASRVWVYNTGDNTATVNGSNYFDPAADTLGLLDDDVILVTQSDGTDIYQVAVSGAGVVTLPLELNFA